MTKETMKERYYRIRAEIIKTLGGKCVRCGTTDNLEFDHIDKTKKKIRASDLHSVSKKRREKKY